MLFALVVGVMTFLLLASCRKLKNYSQKKLFLREELPPEARTSRPSRQADLATGDAPGSDMSLKKPSSLQSLTDPSNDCVSNNSVLL